MSSIVLKVLFSWKDHRLTCQTFPRNQDFSSESSYLRKVHERQQLGREGERVPEKSFQLFCQSLPGALAGLLVAVPEDIPGHRPLQDEPQHFRDRDTALPTWELAEQGCVNLNGD